ncbi:hypothetical protein [Photobacterium nomapromontoriensis]|uniref:hypothetical protein n=1 Tax=Photobacterium nomapromontoriensis TaxID=2910237 RepID=UPI003D0D7F1E
MTQTLQQPAWRLDDAYHHVNHPVFTNQLAEIETLIEDISQLYASSEISSSTIVSYLNLRDKIDERLFSLQAFCKCCISIDHTDQDAARMNSHLSQIIAVQLESIALPFEQYLLSMPVEAFAQQIRNPAISHWQFSLQQKRQSWLRKLSAEQQLQYQTDYNTYLVKLNRDYAKLSNSMFLAVQTEDGSKKNINNAAVVGILKGSPDSTLRATTFEAQNAYIDKHKAAYCDTLNAMSGLRLAWFEKAGVDNLTPSTEQNKLSNETLMAIMQVLEDNRALAQQAIRLRAPYFGDEKLAVSDLLAPAPAIYPDSVSKYSYPEAITTVKTSLMDVHPDMAEFVQMMVDNQWIEGRESNNKIGGAFYTRFDHLKQPRVFSTYMGTVSHITQQAHELGHAWHYWLMRDLPTIETVFPMTLTETASTFNECQVRDWLLEHSTSQAERFSILWQELKTISNFLLNIPVRFDFERCFLAERQHGEVSQENIEQLMNNSWQHWYGDTTSSNDKNLWASKLHFFKADQYIYNYPYVFGYLFANGLLMKKQQMGADFYPFYTAMLRDTGRMTIEQLMKKHLNVDASSAEFWQQSIDFLAKRVNQFSEDFTKV